MKRASDGAGQAAARRRRRPLLPPGAGRRAGGLRRQRRTPPRCAPSDSARPGPLGPLVQGRELDQRAGRPDPSRPGLDRRATIPARSSPSASIAGGATTTRAGPIAQAEVLGIFARERVDYAYFWAGLGGVQRFAFTLYRNPDGHGKGFGDRYLASRSDAPDRLGSFAARRADGALDGRPGEQGPRTPRRGPRRPRTRPAPRRRPSCSDYPIPPAPRLAKP